MIVEYELSNPYVQGVTEGWCSNWKQGSNQDFDSFWIDLEEDECWKHCYDDISCFQAVYEVGQDDGKSQCWTGLNKMTEKPSGNRCPTCIDKCFAKEILIPPVNIKEEKFISSNDVVSTIITSDRSVRITKNKSARFRPYAYLFFRNHSPTYSYS